MESQQTTSNTFTEDGRLLQAEYAIKNVSKAGTIVGMVCLDGVILVGINTAVSPTAEKIYKLSDSSYCAVSGIFSDALRLIKYARLTSANIREIIERDPSPETLTNAIAREKQRYTQSSGSRPFGVSFLYAGYEDDRYVLYSTDPSGTVNKWRAWSFGTNEDTINSGLVNDLPEQCMGLEEGLVALLKTISKARENTPDVSKLMEVLLFKSDGARMLKADEIDAVLSRLEGGLAEK